MILSFAAESQKEARWQPSTPYTEKKMGAEPVPAPMPDLALPYLTDNWSGNADDETRARLLLGAKLRKDPH